jgi:SAM-dependent methyltransferase
MTRDAKIIGLAHWLQTPPGRYVLEWEKAQLDEGVSDIFGFHALQLGLPQVDGLRANRMPHRWLAIDALQAAMADGAPPAEQGAEDATPAPAARSAALRCDFDALPFASQSLDLVVLPHTLELAGDPHQALREVERVLRPEGRVIIVGFNPTSLWGLRQRIGRMRRGLAFGRGRSLFMPDHGELLGYWRLRDWLRLLSFDIEGGRFGRYRPPLASQRWLARFGWMERSGDRWWPVLGAVYFLVAVKRVRGMRLVGLARGERASVPTAPSVVTHRHGHREREVA